MNDRMLRRVGLAGLVVLALTAPATAEVERIRVSATLFTPFYGRWQPDDAAATCSDEGTPSVATASCLVRREPLVLTNVRPTAASPVPYTENLNWDPAGNQKVTFWSRIPGRADVACGQANSDRRGIVSAVLNCEVGDAAGNPDPALRVQIESSNSLGFSVTTDGHTKLLWRSRAFAYERGSHELDFGRQYTGWDGTTSKTTGAADDYKSYWPIGGATIGAVRFTYETLALMGFRTYGSHWQLSATIGGPHTEWNKVLFLHRATTQTCPPTGPCNDDGTFRQNLSSVPHEYGHVVFNHLHSDSRHYWGEVGGYARVHQLCLPIEFSLAHYEGFADAVQDLVFRYHDPSHAVGEGPAAKCPSNAVPDDEGSLAETNVADFYGALVYGHDDAAVGRERADREYGFFRPASGGERYWMFPATALASMVEAGGAHTHTLQQAWATYIGPLCAQQRSDASGTLFPSICSTQAFQCAMQQREILSPYDLAVLGFDCRTLSTPGASGRSCAGKNTLCRSGRCDAGPGTQNSRRCIPKDGTGKRDEACNHQYQCGPGLSCAIPDGETFGTCRARPGIGESCADGLVCAGGRNCDGNRRCVPRMGEGTIDQYCSNQNQCRSPLNCDMGRTGNSGTCRPRPGIGGDCSRGKVCAGGRHCDGNDRCVARQGTGPQGVYCSNNNQCASGTCLQINTPSAHCR